MRIARYLLTSTGHLKIIGNTQLRPKPANGEKMNKRKSVIFATFLSIMQCFLFAESKADHSLHSMDNPSQPLCHWEYSFENQHDLDKWYWVSYPVLNTITDNALIASEFFDELLHRHQDSDLAWQPTYLEEIGRASCRERVFRTV